MGRLLVFTGKGGVGKTSVAAAHARNSANEGRKTLLVSTDMAHNLSDIFEISPEKEPKEVLPNLFVLEIDPNHIMENDYWDMSRAIMNMIHSPGMLVENLEELMGFPGMDELLSLLKIMEIYESNEFERIIIDCAPTGKTLSLLKFPELLSWYMEKFFPIGKIAVRILSPVSKAMFKVELPDKRAMSDIEKMYLKLIQLQELLKNRGITSVRLVSIPEKMVVEETKRNYMYMNLYNFQVDGIYINRILPKDMNNNFFDEWIDIQGKYRKELEEVFSNIPIYYIPWFDSDLNGLEGIDQIDQKVLKGKEIFKIHENLKSELYEKTEDGYLLKIYLPCAGKDDLNMHESDNDIIIKIGNYKRNIPKPDTLRNYEITAAKMKEEMLTITFTKK